MICHRIGLLPIGIKTFPGNREEPVLAITTQPMLLFFDTFIIIKKFFNY